MVYQTDAASLVAVMARGEFPCGCSRADDFRAGSRFVPFGMEIFDPIRILIMQASVREAQLFRKPDAGMGRYSTKAKDR